MSRVPPPLATTAPVAVPRGVLAQGEAARLALHPSRTYHLVLALIKTILIVPVPTVLLIKFAPPLLWTLYASPMTVYCWCPYLIRNYTLYVATSTRLAYRTGVLSNKTHYVPIAYVQDLIVSQSLLQRLVRCGTLTITSAGTNIRDHDSDRPGMVWRHIDNPYGVAEEIRREAVSREAATHQPGARQAGGRDTIYLPPERP